MQKNPKIPEQYQTVMAYLIIPNAGAFISFAENVFDAKEIYKTMRDENTIMHAEIRIGECTIMFADTTDQIEARPAGFFIYVENADETHQKALDAGATLISVVADQPYGRSGGVKDPFGNSWWITSMP